MLVKYRARVMLLSLMLALGFGVNAVAQETPNQAGVVISLEDGRVVAQCVEFEEAQISGYELLRRTGLELDIGVGGVGASVCQIQNSGCPHDDCFCQCKGSGPCLYWSYWHLHDGTWQYSQAGAGAYQVSDGDVDGWVWGVGAPNEAPEPPAVSFAEICQADLAAVTSGATVQSETALPSSAEVEEESSQETPERAVPDDLGTGSRWPFYLFVVLLIGIVVLLMAVRHRKEVA